jgi:N-acetylglucosamine-6-phosphate deacetylase
MIDRHRAPFWAQLADDRLHASIICDAFHLTPELVQVIRRVKGIKRCILVTDAGWVAGLRPGVYHLPHTHIELLPSGQVVTLDRRCLAGSSIGLNRALHVFMEFGGGSLAEAVRAATRNPADLLPRNGICKHISKGQPANLVLFRSGAGELTVEGVILGGELVHGQC